MPDEWSNLVLCTDPDCEVSWAYRDPPHDHYHPRPHGPELIEMTPAGGDG
jgi:hypothetical protein